MDPGQESRWRDCGRALVQCTQRTQSVWREEVKQVSLVQWRGSEPAHSVDFCSTAAEGSDRSDVSCVAGRGCTAGKQQNMTFFV